MTGLITDPVFDLNRTEEYKLSIQVSLDGFSFSVITTNQKKLLVLGRSSIELSSNKFLGRRFKEWIQSNDILQKRYYEVKIIYHSENFTFVPAEYYDSGNMETSGNLVLGNPGEDVFVETYLTYASGNLIFPVSRNLSENLDQLFPGIKLMHPITVLDSEVQNVTDLNENSLAIYFGKKNFSLSLYTNAQLKAVNSYNYANSGDVIYYALAVLSKLKVRPDKTALFMGGEVESKGEFHDNLKKFFKRVILFTPQTRYNSEIFKEPLHRFFVLF